MSKFTLEMIENYADKLLIGLNKEEKDMLLSEFDTLDKEIDKINNIKGISDIIPLSFPFEMEIEDLRSDDIVAEEIDIDKLLQNCDKYEGREVEVPKVVG